MIFDRQAILIYAERNQFGTHGSERSPRTWMAGIFHDRRIASIEQNTRSQVESLLRSGDNNHLPPIASNTPSGTQVVGNHVTKWCIAGRVSISVKRSW
jgi:hypothetical protein